MPPKEPTVERASEQKVALKILSSGRATWGRALPLVLVATGCTAPSTPPHEVFRRLLVANIGRSIDVASYSAYCSARRTQLVQRRPLSNGNEEYKFQYPPANRINACTYFCEVDPKSRTVVAVRIDEAENDCQTVPI